MVWASAISATSRGKLVRSAAQSRKLERNPCTVMSPRPIGRSTVVIAMLDNPPLLLGLPTPVALGWLLPGAALASLVVLAGTTRLDPSVVAASLGSLWVVAVSWPAASRRVPADVVTHLVASAPSQLTALVVALAAIALTLARRDTVAYRRTA